MDLPRKLPEQWAAILKALGTKDNALTNQEMLAHIEPRLHPRLDKMCSNLKKRDFLTSVPIPGTLAVKYQLTDYGVFCLANIDKIPSVPYAGPRPYTTRNSAKSSAPPPVPHHPAPIQINISSTANNVVDQISSLIEENRQYRELIIHTMKSLAAALQAHDIESLANLLGMERENGNSTSN